MPAEPHRRGGAKGDDCQRFARSQLCAGEAKASAERQSAFEFKTCCRGAPQAALVLRISRDAEETQQQRKKEQAGKTKQLEHLFDKGFLWQRHRLHRSRNLDGLQLTRPS